MSVDVAVAATRASSTSRSSGSRPCPARARSASPATSLRSPGGGAITAIGAARLGLDDRARRARSASDLDGRFMRDALEAEGIALVDRRRARARRRPWSCRSAASARWSTYDPRRAARAPPRSPRFEPRAVVRRARPARRSRPPARATYVTLRRRRRARLRRPPAARPERARARCSSTRARRCCSPARATARRPPRRLAEHAPMRGRHARRRTARWRASSGGSCACRGVDVDVVDTTGRRRPVRRRLRLGRPAAGADARGAPALGGPVRRAVGHGSPPAPAGAVTLERALGGGRGPRAAAAGRASAARKRGP